MPLYTWQVSHISPNFLHLNLISSDSFQALVKQGSLFAKGKLLEADEVKLGLAVVWRSEEGSGH